MRLQLQLQNRSGACEILKQTQGICMKFSLLLLPGLAIAAPFGSTAEHPIDDAKIFQRLDREVGALAESGKAPLGREERLKQVTRRTTTVPKLLPASSNILSKEDIYTRAAASTVLFGTAFKCDKCTRWHSAMASGVIIDPSGIVVTNYHVAGAAKGDAMGVMLSDGTFLAVTEILAADQKQDVAIVRIQTGGKALPALPVRTDLRAGGDILCMSNPDNCAGYLSEGIVARYNRESRPGGNGPVWMQITADFAKGSSGGPILDRSGNVVGIVSSTSSVYYDEPKNGGQPNNLQMVRHNCVPSTAILGLTQEAKPAGR